MFPSSLAEWKISLPNLTAKLGGWGFLNKFLLSLIRDCWRTRPSGPSRCPRFCGSQRYVRKTTPSLREGPQSEEQVLGSPRVLLDSPRFVQDGHKVFFQRGILSVKTLSYDSDFLVGLGTRPSVSVQWPH